mgnify:CR=1 FL=1
MTFAQAIKTCFNRYATFTGRATRSEYWWWILFCFLSIIAICIIAAFIGVATAGSRGVGLFGFFFLLPFIIFCIVILVPSWAVLFRRLHDAGHPGYWILLYLVPYVISLFAALVGSQIMSMLFGFLSFAGSIVLLVFVLQPSQPYDNQFGPCPD